MDPWNNESYCVLWNCFCCNNSFIEDMLESGIFDLPSHTKNHSGAFERILGCYFNMKLKTISKININTYVKIGLAQDPFTI